MTKAVNNNAILIDIGAAINHYYELKTKKLGVLNFEIQRKYDNHFALIWQQIQCFF